MSLTRSVLFRLATNNQLERAVRQVPGGEQAAWRMASRYVAGTDLASARRAAHDLDRRGIAASIDQFGELVDDPTVAERVGGEYLDLAGELDHFPSSTWLSVDLSHLGLDIDADACAERLAMIAETLPRGRRLQVGAEDPGRGSAVRDCVLAVAGRGLADRLAATVQANLHRAGDDLAAFVDAGVAVRLVKGAFPDSPEHALPYGEATDVRYVGLAHRLAESGAEFALATHDGVLRESLLASLGPVPVEQLLGVRPEVLTELTARDVPVRVYVPYGQDWFRYWMRRLAESRGV